MLTSADANRILRRFPWPFGVARPRACVHYLGIDGASGLTVFHVQLASMTITLGVRATTAESALCQGIAAWLKECGEADGDVAANALRARLTN